MAKLDLRPRGAWQAEEDAKREQAWLRVHGPGPPIERCCECGEFGCYGDGEDFYCDRHAAESLKRPGDFLEPRS